MPNHSQRKWQSKLNFYWCLYVKHQDNHSTPSRDIGWLFISEHFGMPRYSWQQTTKMTWLTLATMDVWLHEKNNVTTLHFLDTLDIGKFSSITQQQEFCQKRVCIRKSDTIWYFILDHFLGKWIFLFWKIRKTPFWAILDILCPNLTKRKFFRKIRSVSF